MYITHKGVLLPHGDTRGTSGDIRMNYGLLNMHHSGISGKNSQLELIHWISQFKQHHVCSTDQASSEYTGVDCWWIPTAFSAIESDKASLGVTTVGGAPVTGIQTTLGYQWEPCNTDSPGQRHWTEGKHHKNVKSHKEYYDHVNISRTVSLKLIWYHVSLVLVAPLAQQRLPANEFSRSPI